MSARPAAAPETMTLSVELHVDDAWDIAQFLKRLSFSDCRGCACNDEEAWRMQYALAKIREVLNRQGFDPR